MLSNIQRDKWKHFFAGIAMGAFLELVLLWLLPDSIVTSTIIVFIIVVVISYGFELFSKITGLGHYDVYDAIASIVGGVIGMAVIIICQVKFGWFSERLLFIN